MNRIYPGFTFIVGKRQRKSELRFDNSVINLTLSMENQIGLLSGLVSFTAFFLPNQPLHSDGNCEKNLEHLLSELLDLQYCTRKQSNLLQQESKSATQTSQITAWNRLHTRTSGAITEVLGRMPWESFSRIVQQILKTSVTSGSETTLRTALEELGGALNLKRSLTDGDMQHSKSLASVLIDTINNTETTEKGKSAASGNLGPEIFRGCLFCLRKLVEIIGRESKESWTLVMDISLRLLKNSDVHVQSEALSCLGSIIRVVQTALLPRLPEVLPQMLDVIERTLSVKQDDAAIVANAVDVLEETVTSLAAFLSPQLHRIVKMLAWCMSNGKNVKDNFKKAFDISVAKMEKVLTSEIPFRVFFTALTEAYRYSLSESVVSRTIENCFSV